MRVIANKDPGLYRAAHQFALARFEQDRQSYHVTTNLDVIPDVDSLDDGELPGLMDHEDARQLIHITYGSILSSKADSGQFLFRDQIYSVLNENETKVKMAKLAAMNGMYIFFFIFFRLFIIVNANWVNVGT